MYFYNPARIRIKLYYLPKWAAQLVLATYVLACFSGCKQSSPATTFQSDVSFIIAQ